jgi:pyrimidine-nucleoside phosphorylase
LRAFDIIEKKRDGYELSYEEIKFFINEYCQGIIPDYQAAALLMAIFIKGMNNRETADLTSIMTYSGDVIDLSEIPGIKVDKHSTGGVGDKTTLIIGPIVAACGVNVAKMSGRGLGHTGGTIDKLESIPGFKTELSHADFISNVRKIGISVAGQSGNLVPADKKLYALRDVTATINNISLIASSIMSKKIASGADRILLDVKTGSGAFMKTIDTSIALASAMVKIGEKVGKQTAAIVTDMDVPLGNAIGNSLEVIEAIETLKGRGPEDLKTVCIEIASRMLELAEIGNIDFCRRLSEEVILNGKALKKLRELIEQQGGDSKVLEDYNRFNKAKFVFEIISDADGYIGEIKTDMIGYASMVLGAGRETKESRIDYSAGIILEKKTGMSVLKGDLLARIYTNNANRAKEAEIIIKNSISISDSCVKSKPLILANVNSEGIERYFN